MFILNTLAPVFLLIAVGAGLQRSGFVSPNFLKEANRVTYYLGLPALIFSQLAASFQRGSGAGSMFATIFGATCTVLLLAYFVGWLMRVPGTSAGTFVQGTFRGNLAFVGLPIIYSLPDATLGGGMSVRTAALVTVAPMMVFYNVASVVVLLLSQHTLSWRMVLPFLKQVATAPPLIATVAGMAFALAGWRLPVAVDQAFTALGEMALPLGLLGVGGALVTGGIGAHWPRPLVAALLKTVALPAFGWVIGRMAGLGPVELGAVMILMACPTAVTSYALAVELKGDEELASATIVLSVLTSLAALMVILAVS